MKFALNAGAILAGLLTGIGCGSQSAQVTGRVTCQGNPVKGSILFSPKGESESNTGPAVNGPLNEDGTFQLRLTTVGAHMVVITPSDVKFPVPPGKFDYPCDRSAVEREVVAGANDITIEMGERK